MHTMTIEGRELVVLDPAEYQDLIDARDHAIAMREIAAGAPTIPDAEMDAFLAAATPIAFWRRRTRRSQADVAAEIGVTQPFLAQLEAGTRDGTVRVLGRLARALGVQIEDLVDD